MPATGLAPIAAFGRTTVNGCTGDWSLHVEPDGRFLRRVRSDLPSAAGFDGDATWCTDWTGWPTTLDVARNDDECLIAWLWSGAWKSDRIPLEREATSVDPVEHWRLRRLGGVLEFDVAVDRTHGLPISAISMTAAGPIEARFENIRSVGDRAFAHRIVHMLGDRELHRVEIDRVELEIEPGTPDAFAIPEPPADWRYDRTRSPDVEVRRAETGHLLVRGSLDHTNGWFLFDSGAGQAIVARSVASRSTLRPVGTTLVGSVFGIEEGTVYRAAHLEIGPLTIAGPLFAEMDLEPMAPYFGDDLLGIVGYDVLARVMVDVDVARPSIRLLAPDASPTDVEHWAPLRLHAQHPIVECRYEGDRQAWFRLDLGAGGSPPFTTLVFTTAAVQRENLLAGRQTTTVEAEGLSVAVGPLEWFEWAGRRLRGLEVGFMQSGGVLADEPVLAANIGLEVLATTRLVFDYPGARLGFAPRRGSH